MGRRIFGCCSVNGDAAGLTEVGGARASSTRKRGKRGRGSAVEGRDGFCDGLLSWV